MEAYEIRIRWGCKPITAYWTRTDYWLSHYESFIDDQDLALTWHLWALTDA